VLCLACTSLLAHLRCFACAQSRAVLRSFVGLYAGIVTQQFAKYCICCLALSPCGLSVVLCSASVLTRADVGLAEQLHSRAYRAFALWV
jgi:hypothetical protein